MPTNLQVVPASTQSPVFPTMTPSASVATASTGKSIHLNRRGAPSVIPNPVTTKTPAKHIMDPVKFEKFMKDKTLFLQQVPLLIKALRNCNIDTNETSVVANEPYVSLLSIDEHPSLYNNHYNNNCHLDQDTKELIIMLEDLYSTYNTTSTSTTNIGLTRELTIHSLTSDFMLPEIPEPMLPSSAALTAKLIMCIGLLSSWISQMDPSTTDTKDNHNKNKRSRYHVQDTLSLISDTSSVDSGSNNGTESDDTDEFSFITPLNDHRPSIPFVPTNFMTQ